MPSVNVATPSSVQGRKTVVFATQTDGGQLITAVPSPTVDSTSQFSIASVTVDSSLAQKGDLIFAMPPGAVVALSQFVQTYGRCTVTRKRSCDPYETAGYVAGQAVRQVKPGGVTKDLITMPTDISFGDLIQPLAAPLPQVVLFGRQVTALAANSALLNIVAAFLLLAAYAELTTTAPDPTRSIIPASDFSTSQRPQQTGSECPQHVPNCSNCGGNSNIQSDPLHTNGNCVGIKTTKYNSFAAGCVCVDPNDPPGFQPYESSEAISEAQAFLVAMAADGTGDAISTSGSTTIPASSSPSATPAKACNNGVSYGEPEPCEANCSAGTCTRVLAKVGRCKGCTPPPTTYYKYPSSRSIDRSIAAINKAHIQQPDIEARVSNAVNDLAPSYPPKPI
ncbi:hypothetical protein HO173_001248 [Letharia columbiana]|uniref:Uncharacterized protein n=1 Tax=Letharia columbiana TaxID=112416 RepID=A0A8H6L9B4_9LECA|nr:uncharacterized protein HO173_001248 [Letharia columbiana]KAF6240577.1 hypothetical protein HO173_001248 [Letharia columbiana]